MSGRGGKPQKGSQKSSKSGPPPNLPVPSSVGTEPVDPNKEVHDFTVIRRRDDKKTVTNPTPNVPMPTSGSKTGVSTSGKPAPVKLVWGKQVPVAPAPAKSGASILQSDFCIMAEVAGNPVSDVSHKPYPYQTGFNPQSVRIPRLLLIVEHEFYETEKIADYIKNRLEKHLGRHLFIINNGMLCLGGLYINNSTEYVSFSKRPIHAVYPCYSADSSDNLVIGLHFKRDENYGNRSFCRSLDHQRKGGVFHILEDNLIMSKTYATVNVCPADEDKVVFAFYVCEGARLVVTDDREYTNMTAQEKAVRGNVIHHTRSLFQQGALVVVEAMLCIGFNYSLQGKEERDHTVVWSDMSKIIKDSRLTQMPTNLDEKDLLKGKSNRKLGYQYRTVIFLGAVESKHSSITWELGIRRKSDNGEIFAQLSVPDCGYFVDIQSWTPGFEQIFSRHRYQRLHESVTIADASKRLPSMNFRMPAKPEYLKRILNIGKDNHYKIGKPDEFEPIAQKVGYSPPKPLIGEWYEKIITRLDYNKVSPYPVSPLFPPIGYMNGRAFVWERSLTCEERPILVSEAPQLFRIDGKNYKLEVADSQTEYDWYYACRRSYNNDGDRHPFTAVLAKDVRLGSDFMNYRISTNTIGLRKFKYFLEVKK